ncbi:DUF3040 domain-containing protein [Nocardiopsis gilva YIM 90087]|uniref:DUF3040 domain-containing protein n=1 Tax=Nocardiopsis gilva YIM 90087 TaxID=1235441 RepID=A0A223S6M0_9ACTN|nr:DUF3040 domain-containing protein [Nocardiopsis gilva]ASU83774.1 DUF3040 domain-containing protein [Nocardiopsis gilva YIM 90087]
MALREYERRILAEIEHRLSEDDPDLAGNLRTFNADAPLSADAKPGPGWRPWAVFGLVSLAVIALLMALILTAPGLRDAPAGTDGGTATVAPAADTGSG